jgi:hypothetical protein
MDGLGRKIDTFLGEFRIIVPALGAIFAFQLVAAFQDTFQQLPLSARVANFVGVCSAAVALVLLLAPAGYHRFTQMIDESPEFVAFAQRMVSAAFVFIPLSMACGIYVQAVRTFGDVMWAAAAALGLLALSVAMWWVIPRRRARRLG